MLPTRLRDTPIAWTDDGIPATPRHETELFASLWLTLKTTIVRTLGSTLGPCGTRGA